MFITIVKRNIENLGDVTTGRGQGIDIATLEVRRCAGFAMSTVSLCDAATLFSAVLTASTRGLLNGDQRKLGKYGNDLLPEPASY